MGDAPTRYFPAFLDLVGRLVVIIGDGASIAKKAERMTTYGADVVVITSTPTDRLVELEGESALTLEQRDYVPGDLANAYVVILGDVVDDARAKIVAEAEAQHALISAPGTPVRSSYVTPSTLTRGGLQIAVSTAGIAPSLARTIKRDLAETYGPKWADWVDTLAEVKVATADRSNAERSAIVKWLVESDAADRFFADEELTAEALVAEYDAAHDDRDGADAAPVGADVDSSAASDVADAESDAPTTVHGDAAGGVE